MCLPEITLHSLTQKNSLMRSRFGVNIPLWPKDPPAQCITLEFVLTGLVPSKKNRQRVTFNYQWVITQVYDFFKTKNNNDITVGVVRKFIINLVRNIKPWIYKPQRIVDWENSTKEQLHFQSTFWKAAFAAHGLSYPITRCSVSIKYYWKDEYQRDNLNKDQSIHDILVQSGIIIDDNFKCLFKNVSEAKMFVGEIPEHIAVVHITAFEW